MEIKVEGLRSIRADFDAVKGVIDRAAMEGLERVGLEIVAEAKLNLNHNRTNNTGLLRASGKVQKDEKGVDAGFFSSDLDDGYAAYVEFGRGPTKQAGTIPLRTSLKAWVHRKLGIPYGKELDSATYLIARKIHRRGTKPQPFFAPAVKKFEDKIAAIVDKAVKEKTR